jgi:hypothetical protein
VVERPEAERAQSQVPCGYVDFLSEYPTVYVLPDLWRFQIAESIDWAGIDPAEVNQLLETVTIDDVMDPAFWPSLVCLVQIEPHGDLLATRARHKPGSPNFNVALAERHGASQWWTLAEWQPPSKATNRRMSPERSG